MAYGRAYDDAHPWQDDHNQAMNPPSQTVSFHGSSTASHHGVYNGTPFRSAYDDDDEQSAYMRYTNKSRATSDTPASSNTLPSTAHHDHTETKSRNVNRTKQTNSFATKGRKRDDDDDDSDAMYKRYKSASFATKNTRSSNVDDSSASQRQRREQLRNKYQHSNSKHSSDSRMQSNRSRPVMQTMEEQTQYQEQLRQKTKSHLDESLRTALQSEDIAADTSQKLYNQREQLQNIDKMLHETDDNLDRTEHTLQGMKSIWGGMKKFLFRKPPPKKAYMDPLSSVKRDTTSTENGSSNKNEMQSGKQSSESTRVSLGGSEKDDHEFNANLDELHDSVKRMRVMAETMNQELDDQNVLLTNIDEKMDPMAQRIRKQNQTMKRIR